MNEQLRSRDSRIRGKLTEERPRIQRNFTYPAIPTSAFVSPVYPAWDFKGTANLANPTNLEKASFKSREFHLFIRQIRRIRGA
jgi:hypothetical protein